MSNLEVRVTIVKPRTVKNRVTGDIDVESLVPTISTVIVLENDTEAKQLAVEYTLRLLSDIGVGLVITEAQYLKLSKIVKETNNDASINTR